MAMFWQPMKGLANVALTIAVAIVGAGLMVRAAVEPRIIAPAAPPQAAPEHPSQPPVKPLVGIVHDPDGKPVAGATVVAGRFAGGEPNHVIGATGPDGRFELTPAGQSAIPDYVIAYKAGLAPASVLRIPRDDRPVEDEVVLQLPRPAPFVGIVKDREGRPVAGAAVLIRDIQYPSADGQQIMLHGVEKIISETPLRRIFHTTSDAQGQFRFTEMPQRAKGSLVVTAAGMGEYHSMNRKWPDGSFGQEGTAAAPAEVILAPAARVVGRIRSRFPSIKVNGLKVGMQGSQKSHGIWRETRIDATGQFEFAGLDEGTANIFLFDHPNDGPWTYRAAADIELKPGRTTEVEIELIRGVQVEGQVVDADSDRPVAGVGVGLYGPIRPRSGAAIISEMTDKDGRYRFRLPPGETLFYVCGPVPTEYGRMSGGGQTVTIPTDVREFTVPRIEIRKEQPAQ